MKEKRVRTETKTVTTVTESFTHADLCNLLGLPEGAKIWVCVPGGGDWSNMDLIIDDDSLLHAEVVTEKEEYTVTDGTEDKDTSLEDYVELTGEHPAAS